ncbi:NTP transferase domain-containing protein [Listeria sp. PSOL-1]|uniref:NTP transferase domain-containing protein n=1 Tax=Listeria sp. PSOL-1 TaxID=1844999 RepID=UPI0013D2E7DA|nr:NTP transferase domain-containing protein [Listeria sp. PSOL-1]
MMLTKTSVIIMASGKSSRMESNKLWLTFSGKTFIERVIQLASQFAFHECLLVISEQNAKKLPQLKNNMQIIINDQAHMGQSASVKLGTLNATGAGYLFLPVDQPLLTPQVLMKILSKATSENIVVPTNRCHQPCTPSFFGYKFRESLLHVRGEKGGRSIRDQNTEDVIEVMIQDDQVLFDVDTLSDYSFLLGQER